MPPDFTPAPTYTPVPQDHIDELVITAAVMAAVNGSDEFDVFAKDSLARHFAGDDGDLDDDDKALNEEARATATGRVLSSYAVPSIIDAGESKLWIISDFNERSTTILFPSDY